MFGQQSSVEPLFCAQVDAVDVLLYLCHIRSLCAPTETHRECELGGCGPEPAVPPGQDTLPALRTSGLEPQQLDGPQSGGVRLLLQ